jgi:hypothetical protein
MNDLGLSSVAVAARLLFTYIRSVQCVTKDATSRTVTTNVRGMGTPLIAKSQLNKGFLNDSVTSFRNVAWRYGVDSVASDPLLPLGSSVGGWGRRVASGDPFLRSGSGDDKDRVGTGAPAN